MQYLEFKRDKYFQRVYTQKLNPIDQPYSTFFQSRAKSECCKVLSGPQFTTGVDQNCKLYEEISEKAV